MSMINQILRNLDKRQASDRDGQNLLVDVGVTPHSGRRYGPVYLLVLVAVAAGVGALVWSQLQKPRVQAPAAKLAVAAAPDAVSKPSKPATASDQIATHEVVAVRQDSSRAPVAASTPASDAKPAPEQAAAQPAAGASASSATQRVPVIQAVAPDAVSKPSKPDTASGPIATHEVVAVRQDLTRAPVAASTPASDVKPAPEQAAVQPVISTKTTETAKTTARVPERAKPESRAVQPGSVKVVVSPNQQSDNAYRRAIGLLQRSRVTEAQQALREAIGVNSANHAARLLLAGLLIDAKSNAEAEAILRSGLDIAPKHSEFLMGLARLQVANGAKEEALATLRQGLSSAGDDPEYQAFLAALLQGAGRHEEAVPHYITALRSNPSMPSWLIGVGISLQAINKTTDAAEAFERAIDTGALAPEVAQFADQRLQQIRQQR